MNLLWVQGEGQQIVTAIQTAGIMPRFGRGPRVTDATTRNIVEMVLVGKINQEIVALLNRHGGHGVGLSGKDGEVGVARKLKGGDLGRVGEVAGVNARVGDALAGFIPVIAPVAADSDGVTYNINADVVAGKVAEALRAEKLILLTDVEGVKSRDGALIDTLPADPAAAMIRDGTIAGGMIPKVECCLEAIRGGVRQAHVIDGRVRHAVLLEVLTSRGVGTEILPRTARRTRTRAVGA